jgi:hypothetical protein
MISYEPIFVPGERGMRPGEYTYRATRSAGPYNRDA